MNSNSPLTYQGAGVDYDVMDAFKRCAQELAAQTHNNLKTGYQVVKESIGESATVFDNGKEMIATVEEGLGTKNKVSESMESEIENIKHAIEIVNHLSENHLSFKNTLPTIFTLFSGLGQCTLAMIINDLITLGAEPRGVNMHLAVGNSEWFDNVERWKAILQGWKTGCDLSLCAWGGGETPTLKGIVQSETCLLSGSGWGIIPNRNMLHGSRIRPGDAIILYPSSGIHANGLTLCRQIAEKLPYGFFTKMANGELFGQALLKPTTIYAKAINQALSAGADIHYAVNITGHGWRKLMRANEPFCYVIENAPRPQEIFRFIMENGPVDEREAYSNFNMGAGFAVFVNPKDTQVVIDSAKKEGNEAFFGGVVEQDDKKSVIIRRHDQKEIIFSEEEMKIR